MRQIRGAMVVVGLPHVGLKKISHANLFAGIYAKQQTSTVRWGRRSYDLLYCCLKTREWKLFLLPGLPAMWSKVFVLPSVELLLDETLCAFRCNKIIPPTLTPVKSFGLDN